jgi:glycosyltransferase involved in cell wall biosynthesis
MGNITWNAMNSALTEDDVLGDAKNESFGKIRATITWTKCQLGRYLIPRFVRSLNPLHNNFAAANPINSRAAETNSARVRSHTFENNVCEVFGDSNRSSGRHVSRNASSQSLPIKVGFLSYPMLFQNEGGLQVQMRETQAKLRELGIDVKLIDTTRDNLADFDIIHIFAVVHGNVKLVEQARAKGCKVVVSGLLNPALVIEEPWRVATVRMLGSIIARVSQYKVTTDFWSVHKALTGADHIIALSNWERGAASRVFGADPARVSVIANGVSGHFFAADTTAFYAAYEIEGPFVFCPGQISEWKNQISLVKAMANTDITVVLAGPVHENNRSILDDCLAVPNAKVVYLGNLDRMSPVFSGAFAAASAVVLPSKAESGPLVALEALAAGTPAVITIHNGLDMQPDGRYLYTVAPFDLQAMRKTVLGAIATGAEPTSCRAAVEHMSWNEVAMQIAEVYSACLARPAYRVACAAAA